MPHEEKSQAELFIEAVQLGVKTYKWDIDIHLKQPDETIGYTITDYAVDEHWFNATTIDNELIEVPVSNIAFIHHHKKSPIE